MSVTGVGHIDQLFSDLMVVNSRYYRSVSPAPLYYDINSADNLLHSSASSCQYSRAPDWLVWTRPVFPRLRPAPPGTAANLFESADAHAGSCVC